jgi:hypothetical protein
MNTIQKLAIKGKLKQLLPKEEEIQKAAIDINYLDKKVTFKAIGIKEEAIAENSIEEFSQFGEIITSGLKKHLKYDELHRVVLNVNFKEKESFTECYFKYNGKKEYFKTVKS